MNSVDVEKIVLDTLKDFAVQIEKQTNEAARTKLHHMINGLIQD